MLITLVGGQPDSGVVAFHAATGETVWTSVGKNTWNGIDTRSEWSSPTYTWTGDEQLVSYSSPIAATLHGKRHVLCLMRQGLVSLDPTSGKENFKYWFRPRVHESVNAARPVVIGNRVLLGAAYEAGSALLEVNPNGHEVKQLWRERRVLQTHWSTPICVDGYIYGFSGRHENESALQCVNAETGKVVWKTKGFDGDINRLAQDPDTGNILDRDTGKVIPFPFFGRGSKIKVGSTFIILGERGTLALAKIDPTRYVELAHTSYKSIEYPSWAAPVALPRPVVSARREYAIVPRRGCPITQEMIPAQQQK